MKFVKQHFPQFYELRNKLQFDKAAIEALQLDNFPETPSEAFDDVIQPLIEEESVSPTQKQLTARLDTRLHTEILTEYSQFDINQLAMSMFVSNSTGGISSWLFSAIHYNNKSLRVSDEDFRESIRMRLLLPLHDDNIARGCSSCKATKTNPYHGYCCKVTTGAYIYRHNTMSPLFNPLSTRRQEVCT